jgi:hypothetical protein
LICGAGRLSRPGSVCAGVAPKATWSTTTSPNEGPERRAAISDHDPVDGRRTVDLAEEPGHADRALVAVIPEACLLAPALVCPRDAGETVVDYTLG